MRDSFIKLRTSYEQVLVANRERDDDDGGSSQEEPEEPKALKGTYDQGSDHSFHSTGSMEQQNGFKLR